MSSRQRALLLMCCAFLPYLPGGLRAEHPVFALLAIWGAIAFALGRCRIPTLVLASALCLAVSLVALTISSVLSPTAGADTSVLGSFIRLLLPALICLAIAAAFASDARATESVARAIVATSIPIGTLSAASALTDMSGLLGPWVRGGDESVWAQALAIGRFTGLFNQPLEAGVYFTVALFAAIYLLSLRPRVHGWIMIALLCTMAGGLLSLSKNFVVLGLGLGLVLAITLRVISLPAAVLTLGGSVSVFGIVIWRLNEAYVTSLLDLLESGGLVLALTAGRFGGDDTDVGQLFAALSLHANWVTGFGLGAHLPLDNGYLEYFYQGGFVALGCYVVWMLLLTAAAATGSRSREGKLLLVLVAFIAVASLGGPVISANRANVALLALVVTAARDAVQRQVRSRASTRVAATTLSRAEASPATG